MTFGQSHQAALDRIIRQARYLLISFDGPIRSTSPGSLPAPHILDVLTACQESGRSVAVVSQVPAAEVLAYLDGHDLSTQITVVAPSIVQAVRDLERPVADCAAITSSQSDIEAAKSRRTSSYRLYKDTERRRGPAPRRSQRFRLQHGGSCTQA